MQTVLVRMSMSPPEAYENLVIRAVLTNDNDTWIQAHSMSCLYNFSKEQIEECHANIERWLRLHGVTKMNEEEYAALLLVQATIRRWLVRRVLKHQYDMYSRLAQLDSPDHCRRAVSLQRTLARAWEHIHSR